MPEAPSESRGAHGARPPGEPKGGDHLAAATQQDQTEEDVGPLMYTGHECGPHHMELDSQPGSTAGSASGTTPSDALRAEPGNGDGATRVGASTVAPHDDGRTEAADRTRNVGQHEHEVQPSGVSWRDKVRANAPSVAPISEDVARSSHMLEGIWNPVQIKQLMATLMADWEDTDMTRWTPDEADMRKEAMQVAKVSCDESIRGWTARENAIMQAYLCGRLELPHPPNFLKEILVGEHRAMIEDMHEASFNATLTAVVPATVRLTRAAAHATIFKELFIANTDRRSGHEMMRAFQRDAKRISYDGIQTIRVVFYSRRAADRWLLKALRIQKAVLVFKDTERKHGEETTGVFTPAQIEIQYAVRIYGGDHLGLTALARVFAQFAGAKVLDMEYARASRTDIYDNRYQVIRFAQRDCPAPLRGVSKIMLGGADITIHHFQQFLRRPCVRCLNPRHGVAKCSLASAQVQKARDKVTRRIEGHVSPIRPVQNVDMQGASLEEIVEMLRTRQVGELTPTTLIPATAPPMSPAPEAAQPRADQEVETASANGGSTRHPLPDADGFVTKESKRLKKAPGRNGSSKANDAVDPTGRVGQANWTATKDGEGTATGAGPKRTVIKEQAKSKHHPVLKAGKAKGKNGKAPTGVTKRFAQFQRREALGQYGALADSDSDDDESTNMDVDESVALLEDATTGEDENDAPYAFAEESDCDDFGNLPTVVTDGHGGAVLQQGTGNRDCVQSTDIDADEDMEEENGQQGATLTTEHATSCKKESRGSSKAAARSNTSIKATAIPRLLRRPKHTTSAAAQKGGAPKGTQTSITRFVHATPTMQSEPPVGSGQTLAPADVAVSCGDEYIPETPESDEDVIIGETKIGTGDGDKDLPIQIGQWLASFNGREVRVAPNGQCAFLAMIATTINHKATELKNTVEVVNDANDFKWHVYTLMMANLRKDVELRLLDPIQECAKLHPGQPQYTSAQGATAALFAHYDTARRRSASAQVQASYWAGPHELRAMAQYLREPILVFDVNAAGDAHVQRYFYGQHRMTDGSDHESGYGVALTDRQATEYLRSCWTLHVVPTFVVLKHHERHFYGVSHDELFLKWRAEGDPAFTTGITADYEWKASVNILTVHERAADLTTINQLADRDDVNSLLIKRCDMRTRLDIVHARMGLPTLEQTDVGIDWNVLLDSEAMSIHEAYGLDRYATSSQPEPEEDGDEHKAPVRHARPATGDIMMTSYFRILRVGPDAPMDEVDTPLKNLIVTANAEAFKKWCTMYRGQFEIPATKRRDSAKDIRPWLLSRADATRHLFAFLPYPEYEAKTWKAAELETWGAAEIYAEQIGAIQRIHDDPHMAANVRSYCEEWLSASKDPEHHRETAYALARSPQRWKRLSQWVSDGYCRAHPDYLTETEWRVLHVLPYTVSDWQQTPMGSVPNGARVAWYDGFPFVSGLCHGVVNHGDWSSATLAPTGHVWGEEKETLVMTPSSPRRN